MREAVIVSGARTAVGKAPRGALSGTRPDDMAAAAIKAAGFTIERCERFGFRASALEPSVPHILGVARRPY